MVASKGSKGSEKAGSKYVAPKEAHSEDEESNDERMEDFIDSEEPTAARLAKGAGERRRLVEKV